jgi:two-component system response regulator NreC
MDKHEGAGDSVRSEQPVRIVLADDHPVVRGGLQVLIDGEPDFELVAQTGDLDGTVRLVREHRPDVLVLDLNMPGGRVLDAIPGLRAEAPDTQIVVLTMRDDLAFVQEALGAGALAYVLKDAAGTELVHAIRLVGSGTRYVNRELAGRLVSEQMRASGWD